jgi:hypothetical protein
MSYDWEREEWRAARDEQDFGPERPDPSEYMDQDEPVRPARKLTSRQFDPIYGDEEPF